MARLLLVSTLLSLCSFGAGGCEDSAQELPSANVLPQSSGRRRGPPGPEERATGGAPQRARIVHAPADTIVLPDYRGRGGGGGGGRAVGRPYGFPRGPHQEPEDFHAAALDVANRDIRRGSEACELAYEAMRDLRVARQAKTPGRRRGRLNRDNIISSCEQMSEIEQWCLVPSYVSEHVDECDSQANARYRQAVARAERQQDGEGVDWAPTDNSSGSLGQAGSEEAAPTEAAPRGPVRLER